MERKRTNSRQLSSNLPKSFLPHTHTHKCTYKIIMYFKVLKDGGLPILPRLCLNFQFSLGLQVCNTASQSSFLNAPWWFFPNFFTERINKIDFKSSYSPQLEGLNHKE